MEVPLTYSCSTCDAVFASKSERDSHIRRICQSFVTVTDLNGTITRIERINRKLTCFNCGKYYIRSDNLISHWKRCQIMQETQGSS